MKIFEKIKIERKTRFYLFGLKIFSHQPRIKPLDINKVQKKYKKLEKKLQKKEKIKVAFLVSISSMFPTRALFEKMLSDEKFEVSLIIIPDIRFGVEKAKELQDQVIKELSEYKEHTTIIPIDENDDKLKLNKIADIVFIPWIYNISHEKYNLYNLIKANILPAMINYGFFRSVYDRGLISSNEMSLLWKVFAETSFNVDEYKEHQQIKGNNVVLTGYAKMDAFIDYKNTTTRKTIMIAPHHSVEGGYNNILSLSNFYQYADLFLSLPDMYPDIDFIFRPHPALFICLEREEFWGEERVNDYINQMKSKKNVIYSEKGNYFQDFANSDGIIQDCGSYLVEYFYTLKPQCYMLKSPNDIDEKFTELGKLCLENCYVSYEQKAIIKFVEEVIVKENDPMKESREKFAQKIVMLNFPHASEKIIEHLKAVFGENK